MPNPKLWLCAEIVISSLVLAGGIFLLWELALAVWFTDAAPGLLRLLHLARGFTTSLVLAAWAAALVWRARLRYEGEREALHQALAWSEHLTALGRMAAAYAHHLHSPLAAALLRVQRLRDGQREAQLGHPRADPERDIDSLERSLRSCQRSIRRVLDFVDPSDAARHGSTSLVEALEAAMFLLRPELDAHRVVLKLDASAAPKAQLAVPGHRLEAVLVDVIRNAMEAQPEGGTVDVVVETDRDTASGTPRLRGVPTEIDRPPQVDRAKFVNIRVRDQGAGFSADALRRAGEPFYSTKPLGPSLGMGLPLARKFIEDAGGKLSLRNLDGGGAEVTLKLPIVRESARCPIPN